MAILDTKWCYFVHHNPDWEQYLQHQHTEHWGPPGLSPLLFILLTLTCTAVYSSNHIIKFADDTTVEGLINEKNESAYRENGQRLTDWCNNLPLNVDRTKEMVVDFRGPQSNHSLKKINGSSVKIIKGTTFHGVHLAENISWCFNTSPIANKAQ